VSPFLRATLTAHVILMAACAHPASPAQSSDLTVLYAATGRTMHWFGLDAARASLTRRGSVTLPATVHHAATDPARRVLYVGWSDVARGRPGTTHGVSAFAIDPESGALTPVGTHRPLPSRPVFITTDRSGAQLFVAENEPSALTQFPLARDGSIGAAVIPAAAHDVGLYAHQVRVDPSNRSVHVVARGYGKTATQVERRGALVVLGLDGGVVRARASLDGGRPDGFQPRNLDYHPTLPLAYLVLEVQNELQVHHRAPDGTLTARPEQVTSTLGAPAIAGIDQRAGVVVVHPGGRYAYVANRSIGTAGVEGATVFDGAENSIAVFRLDGATGAPTQIQRAPAAGYEPRTMSLDARGRLLAVGNLAPMLTRTQNGVVRVSPNIALFRIGDDGRLTSARTHDVETKAGETLVWTGLVSIR
jgi:6-phosphogluconolactonase (cycloisomerase 2 family)